jgi:predicted NBD/HSP70 family sugar kinase
LANALAGSEDDKVATEIKRQARVLSVALSYAVNVLNPEVVVLGGFLAAILAFDAKGLSALVREQSFAAAFEGLRIVPAELGPDLLMIGAAQLAFGLLIGDPAQIGPGSVGK